MRRRNPGPSEEPVVLAKIQASPEELKCDINHLGCLYGKRNLRQGSLESICRWEIVDCGNTVRNAQMPYSDAAMGLVACAAKNPLLQAVP
jgi:hypothetical protein